MLFCVYFSGEMLSLNFKMSRSGCSLKQSLTLEVISGVCVFNLRLNSCTNLKCVRVSTSTFVARCKFVCEIVGGGGPYRCFALKPTSLTSSIRKGTSVPAKMAEGPRVGWSAQEVCVIGHLKVWERGDAGSNQSSLDDSGINVDKPELRILCPWRKRHRISPEEQWSKRLDETTRREREGQTL